MLLFLLQLIRYLMLGKSFSSFSQTLEFTLNPDRLKKMFQIFWSRFVKQAIDNNAFQQILILYSLKELVIAWRPTPHHSLSSVHVRMIWFITPSEVSLSSVESFFWFWRFFCWRFHMHHKRESDHPTIPFFPNARITRNQTILTQVLGSLHKIISYSHLPCIYNKL